MGNVPEEFQISTEDFKPDDQELVGQIADPINNYILQLNSLLTGQASITAEFVTQKIVGVTPLTFTTKIIQPFGVLVVGWRNLNPAGAALTVAPSVGWTANGSGNLTITGIGFNASDKYTINLMIFTGVP